VDLWLERGRSSVEDDGTVRPEVEEVRPRTSSNLFVRKKYDLVELNFECSVLGVRVCFVVLMFPFNPPELYGFRVQIYTYQINGSILFFFLRLVKIGGRNRPSFKNNFLSAQLEYFSRRPF
jgi:hypothetical protein